MSNSENEYLRQALRKIFNLEDKHDIYDAIKIAGQALEYVGALGKVVE